MLSDEQNVLMCRTGSATRMGLALRRYWIPALLSSDLPEPDGDPRHVELLGEHFAAFRDTQGRVGFLDERCCHRGASLLLGHVSECGIRCIYHGWKFAVDGSVMDTPNVADAGFKKRIRARAYPVREEGGLIWVYLGPREQCPKFTDWPWFSLPAANRLVTLHVQDCNFVQVLEGLVDSSHLGVLHSDRLKASEASDLKFANKVGSMRFDLAPRIEVEETEFGFHYAALRVVGGEGGRRLQARVTAFVAPFLVLNPNGDVATFVVPMNDEKCAFFHVFWDSERPIGQEPLRSEQLRFIGLDESTATNYGIAPGVRGVKASPCRANCYLQNRQTVRANQSFSGLPGLIEEDVAVSVSAGPIRDRSREMLSVSDLAVGRLYRVLLKCARQVEHGLDPIGLDADAALVKGIQGDLAEGHDWRTLVPGHRALAVESVGALGDAN